MALLFRHPGPCREPVISLTNQQRRRNAALLERRYSWIVRNGSECCILVALMGFQT